MPKEKRDRADDFRDTLYGLKGRPIPVETVPADQEKLAEIEKIVRMARASKYLLPFLDTVQASYLHGNNRIKKSEIFKYDDGSVQLMWEDNSEKYHRITLFFDKELNFVHLTGGGNWRNPHTPRYQTKINLLELPYLSWEDKVKETITTMIERGLAQDVS